MARLSYHFGHLGVGGKYNIRLTGCYR